MHRYGVKIWNIDSQGTAKNLGCRIVGFQIYSASCFFVQGSSDRDASTFQKWMFYSEYLFVNNQNEKGFSSEEG